MKRKLYWCAIALIAVTIITGCRRAERQSSGAVFGQNIEGAWRARVEFKDGSFAALKGLEFMYVFNSGGTMTESSDYDAAPPVPPAYGIWRRTGRDKYEAKYEFFTTKAPDTSEHMPGGRGWLPAGRGVLRESISISDDGKSYTSEIRYDLYDRTGSQVQESGSGSGQGSRMTF